MYVEVNCPALVNSLLKPYLSLVSSKKASASQTWAYNTSRDDVLCSAQNNDGGVGIVDHTMPIRNHWILDFWPLASRDPLVRGSAGQ